MKPTEYELNEQGHKQLTQEYLTYMMDAPHITYDRALSIIGVTQKAITKYKPFERYGIGVTSCT